MYLKKGCKIFPSRITPILRDKNGIILATELMLLVVLTILGIIAFSLTNTGMKISGKYKSTTIAYYAAEAGIEEGRTRLALPSADDYYVGDLTSLPDATWSAYILTASSWRTSDDPKYDSSYKNYVPTPVLKTNTTITANSLQSNLSYWVKLRHKREYDAETDGHTTVTPHYYDNDGDTATHTSSSSGSIIFFGYGDPSKPTMATPFTTSFSTEFSPIQIIRAYGQRGSSSQVIEIEVSRTIGPPMTAPLYGRGNITINGSSGYFSGNDNCGEVPAKPPIYTLAPATTTASGSPVYEGSPSSPQSGTVDIDIAQYVNELKEGATVITSDVNGTNFGSPTNFVTVYSNTSNPYNVGGLKIQNGTGYGILVVDGDLTLGGGVAWHGLVLATGTITFSGGGSGVNIYGAILGNEAVDMNGGLDIRYDSCMMKNSLNSKPFMVMKWKQVY